MQSQPTLVNLHPKERLKGLCCDPFVGNLDRCFEICNTLKDSPNKLCVLNKTEGLNLRVFNINSVINESNTLTKQC